MADYYPEYQPRNVAKFDAMVKMLGLATSPDGLRQIMMLYVMDMAYDREDILVALGRTERSKGWKLD